MLAERIAAVAPDMPPEMRRWFLEQAYAKPSVEDQDWDLILAEWNYVSLLMEYTEDQTNVLDKRFEAFSALMVLQGHKEAPEVQRKNLTQEIKRIVLGNHDFAREASEHWLGLTESLTIRRMLGEEIPEDVPQWIREEVTQRA